MAWRSSLARPLAMLSAALLTAACADSSPWPALPREGAQPDQPARIKTLTVGVTGGVQAMSVVGSSTTAGGWHSMTEVHSNGLITSDFHVRRPIGQLAERAPSLDEGTVSLLPDGRMRVVYTLRPGITWHDGTPFTAQDLVFSYKILSDPGMPFTLRTALPLMDSVEGPDHRTFIVYYRSAYYLGGILGAREFWPLPQHLLGEPYERYLSNKNVDVVASLPYWTGGYIHLGPFRLISFDPGEGTAYQAYPGYFLGRPKLDVIRVRTFPDANTLFANLLAGAVDMMADTALSTELGFQLKDRWDSTGEGTVHVRPGSTRFLAPQWRPGVQTEPANLDPRVRAALYHAIDRESLSEREPPAWSILPPGDRLYEATKDGLRQYPYDPDRAKALLRDLGWTPGPDAILRHGSDGRKFRNAIWATVGGRTWEISVYADYWRRIGLEVEEYIIPAVQMRDQEFRAHYPSWEASSAGQGDSFLGRLQGPAASAETRWVGNRGGYEDPRAQLLLDRYYTSISERDLSQAMRGVSEFVTAELPLLVFYYTADLIGARKGVRALEDVQGGTIPSQYGTYSRNSHQWDLD